MADGWSLARRRRSLSLPTIRRSPSLEMIHNFPAFRAGITPRRQRFTDRRFGHAPRFAELFRREDPARVDGGRGRLGDRWMHDVKGLNAFREERFDLGHLLGMEEHGERIVPVPLIFSYWSKIAWNSAILAVRSLDSRRKSRSKPFRLCAYRYVRT